MSDESLILGGTGGIDANGFLRRSALYYVDTEAECLTVGHTTLLGMPQKKGGRSWAPTEAGKWKATVVYEGLIEEDDPESAENFSIKSSKNEEPMESHPAIERLIAEYQGTEDEDGKITFPRFLTKSNGATKDGLSGSGAAASSAALSLIPGGGAAAAALSTAGTGASGSGGEQVKNPMFGWDSYIRKAYIVSWTFGSRKFPQKWADLDGHVIDKIPGPYPTPSGEKNWLVWFEASQTRGSGDQLGHENTIDFVLSMAGGWPPMHLLIDPE